MQNITRSVQFMMQGPCSPASRYGGNHWYDFSITSVPPGLALPPPHDLWLCFTTVSARFILFIHTGIAFLSQGKDAFGMRGIGAGVACNLRVQSGFNWRAVLNSDSRSASRIHLDRCDRLRRWVRQMHPERVRNLPVSEPARGSKPVRDGRENQIKFGYLS